MGSLGTETPHPDPELVDYYSRTLRAGYDRAFGGMVSDAHEAEGLRSILTSADRLAEQLDQSVLDAPWLRGEVGKLVGDWVDQPGEELDFSELVDSLNAVFSPARALMIARSEVAQTFNGAFAAGLRAHGWTNVIWIAAPDACEECAAMDGQVLSISEYESSSTLHPNCSCSCEPDTGGNEEQ
jgi:hypothetical protein